MHHVIGKKGCWGFGNEILEEEEEEEEEEALS